MGWITPSEKWAKIKQATMVQEFRLFNCGSTVGLKQGGNKRTHPLGAQPADGV
jgi:hypothetical protein